MNEQEAQLFLW